MNLTQAILFLPSWYPNRCHLSLGSFIRSHAEAINELTKVDVLFVYGDSGQKKSFQFESFTKQGVDTHILYYRKWKASHRIAKLTNGIRYGFALFYSYFLYRKLKPRPTIFHIHVLSRTAILPIFLRIFGKVDYFITEHWTRYLPEDNRYQGFLRKVFTRFVVQRSLGISAVSINLKNNLIRHQLVHNNFPVISNVISPAFFTDETNPNLYGDYFVHVSNFTSNMKNVLLILQAFAIAQNNGVGAKLVLVGDGDEYQAARHFVEEHALSDVFFTGFSYGAELVRTMQHAKALVIYSKFETQCLVAVESICLGVPVISSDIPAVAEFIDDSNGILVVPNQVAALSEALSNFEQYRNHFDREFIKQNARSKFNTQAIAHQFIAFYRNGGAKV
jgi:glycosyltransferase involved in cell wall biosynthesis